MPDWMISLVLSLTAAYGAYSLLKGRLFAVTEVVDGNFARLNARIRELETQMQSAAAALVEQDERIAVLWLETYGIESVSETRKAELRRVYGVRPQWELDMTSDYSTQLRNLDTYRSLQRESSLTV